MVIKELSAEEYATVIKQPLHAFNKAEFNTLNKTKASSLYFLLFSDTKPRMGIIVGVIENELRTPFSAPFGGFSNVKEGISLEQIEAAVENLIAWMTSKKINSIKIGLPPSIYNPGLIAKITNVLYRLGFTQENIELNYAFNLDNFHNGNIQNLRKNARKNLRNALANDLHLQICKTIEEQEQAYDIIASNRKSKGYPLRMSWEQIIETLKIIDADFFIVNNHNSPVAAAMVFHVSTVIVQVVYWGDLVEYSHLRPINFLAFRLFGYYKEMQFQYVDIGPSTENSQPNYGLCDFKESIGCDIQLKTTWSYQLA